MISQFIQDLESFNIIGYKKDIVYDIDTIEEKNFIDKSITINVLPIQNIEDDEFRSLDFNSNLEIYICQNVLDTETLDTFLYSINGYRITSISIKEDVKLFICKINLERIICL